jgi:PKD repeat protein
MLLFEYGLVSEYTFTEPLVDGIYYCRVRAVGMNESSAFSPTDRFVIAADRDGILMVAAGIDEPVPLPTTVNAADEAIDLLDFTLKDGGGPDELPLKVSAIVIHTSGAADFGKVVFRLKGPDVRQMTGVYDTQAQTLIFGGLGISVDDGQSETYVIDAFFQDNTGVTEGRTFALGLDGDVDLTMVAPTTWMSSTNQMIGNGTGSAVQVDATRLMFTRQPEGAVHDQPLGTQPVLKAADVYGNVDVDFVEEVGLSVTGGSELIMYQGQARAVGGVATFGGVVIRSAGADRRLIASAQHLQADRSAPFAVQPAPTSMSLSGLQVDYDSTPKAVVVQTQPLDLSVEVTYDGSPDAPVGPGSFQVQAAVTDGSYIGQVNGTLVITPPPPPVALLQTTPMEGNPGFVVTFTDASTGYVGSRELRAKTGEGQETKFSKDALKQPVTVTYPNPGTYPAVLTMTGPGGADQATVEIVVHAPPTVASIEPVTVAEDGVLVLDLSGKDAKPGTWTVEDADPKVIASAVSGVDAITFTPVANAHGSDQVRIVRTNAHQLSTAIMVTLTWTAVDDPPEIEPALEGTFTIAEDMPIPVGGVAHARDVDTDAGMLVWSATGYDRGLVGSVQGGNAGVTFTPVENAHGTSVAVVHLIDPSTGKEATQSVQLTWTPVNDLPGQPVAVYPSDRATDVSLAPLVTWTAEEVDGEPLAYDFTLSTGAGVVAEERGLPDARYSARDLQPGAAYSWAVVAHDGAGSSPVASFTFTTEADRRPPVVSDVRVAATHQEATVSWATDETATGAVTYRSLPEDGSQPVSGSVEQPVEGAVHQAAMSQLQAAMWYEYEVTATDGAQPQANISTPIQGRFRTGAAPDLDGPVIQVGPFVEGIARESAVVRWTTDELSTSVVRFWDAGRPKPGAPNQVVLDALVDDHQVKLTGLTPGETYAYEIQSIDGAKPPNESEVKGGEAFTTETEKDEILPAFEEGPAVQSVTDASAVVALRASEPVQVEVRFDEDAELGDGRLAISAQAGTAHQLSLTELTGSREYHYQVMLRDEAGNLFASGLRTFTTRAKPDQTPPSYLIPPAIEGLTNASAVVTLTANEPVRVQVLVAPVEEPENTVLRESREPKPTHSIALVNLEAERDYLYEVRIEDGAAPSNSADPARGRFTTQKNPDETPPVVSGPIVEGVSHESATIVFSANEPMTAVVKYGQTALLGEGTVVLTELAQEHRVQLTRLEAGKDYIVQVVAQDGTRPEPNAAQPKQEQFATPLEPDETPPQKTGGPEVEGATPTSATLSVTYNEPVELQVKYGAQADLQGAEMMLVSMRQTAHRLELTNLKRGTRYYVQMVGRDAAGWVGDPVEVAFDTPLKDKGIPPRFVTPPGALEVNATSAGASARLGFTADEPVRVEIRVSAQADLSDPLTIRRPSENRKTHQVQVDGLQGEQTYYFGVTITSAAQLTATATGSFTTPMVEKPRPPQIVAGPSLQKREDESATVYLRTDKASVVEVKYWSATPPGAEVLLSGGVEPRKEHAVVLTPLSPSTSYAYSVRGKAGDQWSPWVAGDGFTTRDAPDATPPQIQGTPTVTSPQHDRVTIIWTTDEPSDSQVRVWSDGQEWNARNGTDVEEHRVTVTNLEGGKTYSYQVWSMDAAENGPTQSAVRQFTTPVAADVTPPQFAGKPIVKGQSQTTVVLGWTADEDVTVRVAHGKSAAFELGESGSQAQQRDWEWTLTGLDPGQSYYVRVTVTDVGGLSTMYPATDEMSWRVETQETPPPPVQINNGPIVVSTTQTEAVIEWNTDYPADSRLSYAWSEEGAIGNDGKHEPERMREHRVVLTNLHAGMDYTCTVASQGIDQPTPTESLPLQFRTRNEPDTRPPAITEGPSALDVTPNEVTLFWRTDEPATTVIDYGTTKDYGNHLEFGELVQEHRVLLGHLDPGATYHFAVGSADLAGHAVSTDPDGNQLYSIDHTFTTLGQQDNRAPKFEQPPTVAWTNTTAVVNWSTDEVATSRVDWVGGGRDGFVEDNHLVREHALTLTGLQSRTGYRFKVTSEDRAGNPLVWGATDAGKWVPVTFDAAGKALQPPGGAGVFVTDNVADTQYPVITSGPTVSEKTVSSLTIAWETDELADSFVRFGASAELEEEVGAAQDVRAHRITLTNLDPETTYHFRVASTDPSGNGATESGQVVMTTSAELDLSPPRFVVSPRTVSVTDQELVVAWETDEAASAQLAYQRGEEIFTRQVSDRQTRHRVTLTNLEADSEYRVRIFATDASQNQAEADVELRVQTESAPDLEAPVLVSGPEVMSLDDRSAVIEWETDEVADSFVDYDTTPYLGQVVGRSQYVREHRMTLTNLLPGTTYHFRVGGRDRAKNGPTESEVAEFTTQADADLEAPPMPEGLVVRPGLDASWLEWEACPAGDLSGYAVYRARKDGTLDLLTTHVMEPAYLDVGLEAGVEYRYQVTALDRQNPPNESALSAVASGIPGVDRVPGAPTVRGLETGAEPGKPVVLVENATSPEEVEELFYTVQVSTGEDFDDVVDRGGNIPEGAGITRWRVNRPLDPAQVYWWRARASDGRLDGPWSTPVSWKPADAEGHSELSADFDGDGAVSFGDFFQLADGFGGSSPELDLDGNGSIGFGDFFQLADAFGQTTASKLRRAREIATDEGARIEVSAEEVGNQKVEVRLQLEGLGKLTGYGCRLSYDTGALRFVGLADSSHRLLGGPEVALLLAQEKDGGLRLAEHLRGKLEGMERPQGMEVRLAFALRGRPQSSRVRVEEGYVRRGRRELVAMGYQGETQLVPQQYALYPGYPNPFNPTTTIPLALPVSGEGRLVIFNTLGQVVRTWKLGELEPGFHAVVWDGRDDDGRPVGSGVYLVRMQTGEFRQTRKLLLLR